MMGMRSVSIEKNGQHFIFRYQPGCEDDVVEQLMACAETDSCPLDWMDAATLSFQVTQRAAVDCYGSMGPYDSLI
ncbi:MAG: hypothetical protein ACLFUJ_12885 [Phycisphaerae bacterium]